MMDLDFIGTEPTEVLKWINGEDDGVTRYYNGMPEVGTEWYIVSTTWLSTWKQFIGYLPKSEDTPQKLPLLDNSDIILQDENILKEDQDNYIKPGLSLSRDYELLPTKAWEFFKQNYQVLQSGTIKRESVQINSYSQTQVEITFKPVKVVIVNVEGSLVFPQSKIVYISRVGKVQDLKEKIRRMLTRELGKIQAIDPDFIRLTKLKSGYTLKDIRDKLPLVNQILPVTKLDIYTKIRKAEIAQDDLVIVDIRDSKNTWSVKAKKSTFFQTNPYQTASRGISGSVNKGKAGLQNLGNTCFMNSGLQCLSNTTFLTHYFLSDQYKSEINLNNPLGTRGRLVQGYANLVKELWEGSSRFVSPWQFKTQLAKFARQFSGYDQHDSQQMLSFLLDGLHQDLNRVLNKPYNEELKLEGKSESEMAQMFWQAHLSRNQSIIVDNMYGQYRSEVVCPQCNKPSLAFDPFLMLTLPLPVKQRYGMDVTVVPLTMDQPIQKLKIILERQAGFNDVKEEIRKMVGKLDCEVLLASVFSSTFEKFLTQESKLKKQRYLHAYIMDPLQEGQVYILIQNWKRSRYYSNSSSPLAVPRFIKIQKNLPVNQLTQAIFKYFISELQGIEDQESVQQKFEELFTHKSSFKEPLFKLSLINPQRKKFYSMYNSKRNPCPFCRSLNCSTCQIPNSEETIQHLIERTQGLLKIEAVWSGDIPQEYVKKLNQTSSHSSLHQNSVYLREQKSLKISIQECLALASQPETLDAQNTSYCSACKEHVQGTKKMDIYKLPDTLIIHIKRFKQSGYFSTKNNRLVEFPIEGLDMTPYCLTEGKVYDLYAVSNHYGSLGGGHYTAFAKNGQWLHYDDSSVSHVRDFNEIVSQAAYVLFYKARSQQE